MNKLPALFISHGSPMTVAEDSPARNFLLEWGRRQPKPKAILVASAHWENIGGPAVSLAEHPETIYDFGGFPRELYQMRYAAPGAPALAETAAGLLEQAGFAVRRSPDRGLDHGAWVPLKLMYPDADIPVFQVSLIHEAGPAEHYRLGQALQPMRDLGVLVVGSGSLTHNLFELTGHRIDDAAPRWVADFEEWIADAVVKGKPAELLDYRRLAPYAARNHPTEDHLLPLFVALGAAGEHATATRIHASHTYGVLAMDAYAFAETVS